MRSYNNKNWLSVFTLYRHDTARTLWPVLLAIGLYAFGVDYWVDHDGIFEGSRVLKNLIIVHSLLGLVISLLLVFRTNTAYDRWWEGRKHWGALVNNSRNMALKLNAILAKDDKINRHFFNTYISLYAKALDQHLKSKALALSLDDADHPDLQALDPKKHLPNQIAAMLQNHVFMMGKEGKISKEELLMLNAELTAFTDICGACERIKNTPIPYSYASFIKKFILLYVLSLPWSLTSNLGYWSIAVVMFIMYALGSLEIIAEEIEEPFGTDANDLPTEKIAENIGNNVNEILG